jgi:hypothetical protein
MRCLFACLAMIGLAGPAAACINDVELPNHEREFRSQYRGPDSQPPSTEQPSPVKDWLLLGFGGALLVGAMIVPVRDRRTRS